MKFKGTKGNWEIKQTKKGHYKINGDFWDGFCKIYTVKNVHKYEIETKANALLISKAPEMLEMLERCAKALEDLHQPFISYDIKQLIIQATDL